MTEEEARELGWEGDELREYMAGRATAEATLAAIMTAPQREQPVEEAAAPPGPTEVRARALAGQLEAESAAADARTRARRVAETAMGDTRVMVTDRPGAEPSLEDQRQWALAKAMEINPPVLRPGPENAMGDYVITVDGEPRVVRQPVPPVPEVILPDQWEQHDKEWRRVQRERENALLCAAFGEQVCAQAGIIP